MKVREIKSFKTPRSELIKPIHHNQNTKLKEHTTEHNPNQKLNAQISAPYQNTQIGTHYRTQPDRKLKVGHITHPLLPSYVIDVLFG